MKKIISAAALAAAAISITAPAHADEPRATDLIKDIGGKVVRVDSLPDAGSMISQVPTEEQLYTKVRGTVTEYPENYGLPTQGADATNLDKTVLNVTNKFLENNNPMGSPQPKGSSTFTLGSVSDLSKGLDISDIPKGLLPSAH
ncbi:hypothetical protein ACFXB3_13030 [Streptomyces sp. NPDC059447]|uniref:hypothetical protein n=1 Tax=Streptomyces sp. NPDC059447 TaxID=3346834 RepID=UPI0036B168D5